MTLALISNIANYLKYNHFWDCDGIDNVTLRLLKSSDFCWRHTVGVAGDDIMFHILVLYIKSPVQCQYFFLFVLWIWKQHSIYLEFKWTYIINERVSNVLCIYKMRRQMPLCTILINSFQLCLHICWWNSVTRYAWLIEAWWFISSYNQNICYHLSLKYICAKCIAEVHIDTNFGL